MKNLSKNTDFSDKTTDNIALNFELADFLVDKTNYIYSYDKQMKSSPWVNWGEDNNIPIILWENYLRNSLITAIINSITDYVYGDGISYTSNNLISDEDEGFDEVVRKCVFDYILFGGFTVECIRNSAGKIVRYNYQNVMNVRVDEDLTTAYISNKWGKYTSKYVTLPLWNKNDIQDHFIFYYRGPITRGINPIPSYASALKSIEILNSTRDFHLNNLKNGFTTSVIINLNNENIKGKELREIKEKLTTGYTGTMNAGKFLLLNGGSKDHAATVERLSADNFGELYMTLDESSRTDIYCAFRINPILIGENVQTGFSKEEFASAYELFYSTVVRPIQNIIQKQFAKLNAEFVWNRFNPEFPE